MGDSKSKKLSLSLTKCFFMSITTNSKTKKLSFNYSINQSTLTEVSSFTDLGATYTDNLYFNSHISAIISKSFKMLGFYHTLVTLYK